jgi:hypothetical protein
VLVTAGSDDTMVTDNHDCQVDMRLLRGGCRRQRSQDRRVREHARRVIASNVITSAQHRGALATSATT